MKAINLGVGYMYCTASWEQCYQWWVKVCNWLYLQYEFCRECRQEVHTGECSLSDAFEHIMGVSFPLNILEKFIVIYAYPMCLWLSKVYVLIFHKNTTFLLWRYSCAITVRQLSEPKKSVYNTFSKLVLTTTAYYCTWKKAVLERKK